MKKIFLLPVCAVIFLGSCKSDRDMESFIAYGEEFSLENPASALETAALYKDLKPGDSLPVSFQAEVASVCKNKGCWMTLDLPGEEAVMVKFRDYGFFVPKDIEEKHVVVKGKAYVTEVSVEEQRHYAEDKGDTPEDIAAITQPKRTLSFLADGVLIAQ